MSIYSNDNIRKIAKLTTRELLQKSKNAKIMAYNNNNNIPFLYSAYHIQMASLCARGIITPALALMQPFSAKSIRRNKFLLGTHLLHLGRERQLWTKCLV